MQTISADDYHDLVRVGDPRLSPDGERVAFVRTVPRNDEESEATVYTVSLGGEGARRFTLAEGVDSEPRWSPSGDRLAFVSTRGDDDRPQLWVAPTDGGEARRVTDVVGGVSSIAWSPDGERIAFVQSSTAEDREEGRDVDLSDPDYEPEAPDPRVIDRLVYRAGARYFDGGRSHVYLADVDGDAGVARLTDGDYDHVAPEWGDSNALYYAAKRTDDPDDNAVHDVIAHDLGDGSEEVVVRTTGWAIGLAATADGRVAYHYTPDEGSTLRQTEIRVFDRRTEEATTVTESIDRTVEGTPKWGPDGEHLYFLTPDEGDVALRRTGDDGVETVVRDGHIDGFDPGRDAVAITKSEWDHPGDLFVSTPAGAETNRLTRTNRDYLTDRAVPQPEELWFESEGEEVQGWVLTPPDMEDGESYPLVVEIHGGPHAMWSTTGTMWHEFQTLAARGYVVFWCNPRGSTGYGEEHMAAIERDWGAVTMRDVLAGADAVCERGYVDESQQFVTGGSFGGYMTGWIVGHTDRFSGAVAQRGVYDLSSFYGSTDAFKLVEWDFGTEPWDEPEFLWKQSPVAHAGEVETPTLVIHADEDYRVPVNNGEMFYLFLKKNGVDTRLVRYPREGHELSRSGEPGHVVDRIERIARWFDGYSEHHDVPKALERGDEGLSAGEEAE